MSVEHDGSAVVVSASSDFLVDLLFASGGRVESDDDSDDISPLELVVELAAAVATVAAAAVCTQGVVHNTPMARHVYHPL